MNNFYLDIFQLLLALRHNYSNEHQNTKTTISIEVSEHESVYTVIRKELEIEKIKSL